MTGSNNISTRVILPADDLSAVYDPRKHQLTLSARGNYFLPIVGGKFLRLPWPGLTFLLLGWTSPEEKGGDDIQVKLPFQVSTSLNLGHFPGLYVTVIDLHHLRGVRVPIRYLGLKEDDNTRTEETSEEGHQVPEKTVLNNERIYVLEGEPFNISAPATSEHAYSYHVDNEYNQEFLRLIGAKIEGGRIIWTFIALKLGQTQVVVSELGTVKPPAIGAWWQEQTYDVHVILKNE